MMLGNRRAAQISFIALRDSHVEVDVGIIGFAFQGFFVGVQCGFVVAIGIMGEAEKTISVRICGIDTERGARFGEGIVAVVATVEVIRELAMGFRERGHHVGRVREGIEGFVEAVLATQDRAKHKKQQTVARIAFELNVEFFFGGGEVFCVNESRNLSGRADAFAG